jgi:hypothetical protein
VRQPRKCCQAQAVTGWLLLAVARRLLSESADGVAARKTACSLDGTCSSVKLNEAREWILLVPTYVFANLQWSLVSIILILIILIGSWFVTSSSNDD